LSLPPTQFFFFFVFGETSPAPTPPTTYYPSLSPTELFTYIFKSRVDSSPSTYSPINLKCTTLIPTHLFIYLHAFPPSYLPTNTLGRYLSNLTYMATPTYLVASPIDPNGWKRWKNKMKVLHGAWSCSLEQITKGTINVFVVTYLRVLQIDIGF
jgi:hypothetical protein